MPLAHIQGVDHVVVAVRDLDAAAQQWGRLGFTVSPRGTHSPQMGTANYTIMLGDDYLELIGVIAETPHNAPTRALLAEREGIERTAFTTDDAAAGAAEIKARGFEPLGPVHFGRPVTLPGGRHSEARFNVFRWPLEERPAGMGIFACQHLTRETVWIPELQRHANGATCIIRIELVAAAPKTAAEHLGRLIGEPATATDSGWRVASGAGRADFLFVDPTTFARLYPEAVRKGAMSEGAAALVIGTRELASARAQLPQGVMHEGRLSIPAADANGVILVFEQVRT